MHPHPYSWQLRRALIAGSITAIVVAMIAVVGWQRSPAAEFNRARAAWQRNAVAHYRLVIERPQIWCQQDVEVQNEQIVTVIENNCPIESLTVSMLYDRIADLDGLQTDAFLPVNLCTCRSELQARVRYDPDLSYPIGVTITEVREVNWRELSCWQALLRQEELPICDLPPALAQPRITHISLIPLSPVSATE